MTLSGHKLFDYAVISCLARKPFRVLTLLSRETRDKSVCDPRWLALMRVVQQPRAEDGLNALHEPPSTADIFSVVKNFQTPIIWQTAHRRARLPNRFQFGRWDRPIGKFSSQISFWRSFLYPSSFPQTFSAPNRHRSKLFQYPIVIG
jgi:hypothetical protein